MIVYDIYIKNLCKCKSKQKVASFDYLCNAVDRKNDLIKTFGTYRVLIQRREIKVKKFNEILNKFKIKKDLK